MPPKNVVSGINSLNLDGSVYEPSQIDTSSLPPGYEKLSANNPWRNMQYTQSFWDKVKGMLGFRTDAQKFSDEAFNNAQLYDAQLLQLAREEQYNSAQAQTERLRQAGINPDLAGDVSAGDASEFDNQSVNAPDTPNESNEFPKKIADVFVGTLSAIDSSVNAVIDILQKSLSFAKDLYGDLGVTANSVDDLNSWVDDLLGSQTTDAVRYSTDGTGYVEDEDGNRVDISEFADEDSDLRNQISKYVRFYSDYRTFANNPKVRARFKTRYARERAWQAYRMRSTSPDFLNSLYDKWNTITTNRSNFNRSRASKFYKPDDASQIRAYEPLVTLTDTLVQLEARVNGEMQILRGDYLSAANDGNPMVDEQGRILPFYWRRESKRNNSHFRWSIFNVDGMSVEHARTLGQIQHMADESTGLDTTYRENAMQEVEEAFAKAIAEIQMSDQYNDKERAYLILLLEQARSKQLVQSAIGGVSKILDKALPGTNVSEMKGFTESIKF